mgnify:CR=1 FL=1
MKTAFAKFRRCSPGAESHMEISSTELKANIIEALKLQDITPADIGDDDPLFGEGLGLDSIDALELVDISNNIGDARSLLCHPASTTHANMGEEPRAEMGVTEGLLRINVGLEDIADIIEDIDQALGKAGI